MNILEKIVAYKKQEVERRKGEEPVEMLERKRFFSRPVYSLKKFLAHPGKTGIIAEYKRKSPSKGVINDRHSVEYITRAYEAYGASGISVLTDYKSFGGSLDDLLAARDNSIPLLRKEFVVDEYQVIEAKAYGADAILLIAACLQKSQVKQLASTAKNLGLEVLLELHGADELDHLCHKIDLVGINNRNLKTFEVDLQHSVEMASRLPGGIPKIAESGINSVADVRFLKEHGFSGFLIGEYFMRQQNPPAAFKEFSYAL